MEKITEDELIEWAENRDILATQKYEEEQEQKKMSPETRNWVLSKLGELSNKFYEVDKKHEKDF